MKKRVYSAICESIEETISYEISCYHYFNLEYIYNQVKDLLDGDYNAFCHDLLEYVRNLNVLGDFEISDADFFCWDSKEYLMIELSMPPIFHNVGISND